jgi:hypothetical protein
MSELRQALANVNCLLVISLPAVEHSAVGEPLSIANCQLPIVPLIYAHIQRTAASINRSGPF